MASVVLEGTMLKRAKVTPPPLPPQLGLAPDAPTVPFSIANRECVSPQWHLLAEFETQNDVAGRARGAMRDARCARCRVSGVRGARPGQVGVWQVQLEASFLQADEAKAELLRQGVSCPSPPTPPPQRTHHHDPVPRVNFATRHGIGVGCWRNETC